MRFKIIGPLHCAPPSKATGRRACPMTFTTSVVGYSALGFVNPDATPLKKEVVFDLMVAAIDQGINLFYGSDTKIKGTEFLLGELIESMRDRVVLIAKHKGAGSPENIRFVLDEHCAQFRTEYIDLYSFEYDPSTLIEESMACMQELLDAHKIKGVILSGIGLNTDLIERAHSICPITAIQVNYSLWNRSIERTGIFETCHRLGIVCIACTSLEMEFTPKTVNAFEPSTPEERLSIEGLKGLATRKGITPAQVEIAWTTHQGCFPFVASLSRAALLESTTATDIKLSREELALLDTLFPLAPVAFASTLSPPAGSQSIKKTDADTPLPSRGGL